MSERIKAAALKMDDDSILWQLPPARHHTLMHIAHAQGLNAVIPPNRQGFITDADRYVGREEALAIAEKSGQIIKKYGNPSELYSEDCW